LDTVPLGAEHVLNPHAIPGTKPHDRFQVAMA
jgi:hypothetical protein